MLLQPPDVFPMLTSPGRVLVTQAHPKGVTVGPKATAATGAARLIVVRDQANSAERAIALDYHRDGIFSIPHAV